ncbi:Transcription factor CYCLOIDEA like [Quillaja saponaria]|uniref:Transcription factor CYCLOIDEA like n=2 Tax=Quillaja saponaria TaxID=32244 RepID=A0AAD7QC93_QUISA|nr:Transcription factor CYCLOIDEA like [Quillaja saponaria]
MYPSNKSNNGKDPISYSESETIFSGKTFLNDFTFPNAKQDQNLPSPPPLSFLHFPSPFGDDEIFLQQLHDQRHLADVLDKDNDNMTTHKKLPRKRCSGRDRHSKINTAKGPRDRRMRMSLEVARKFFGLQDMLGFDKGSKTLDWLLNQAKDEIEKLAMGMKYNLKGESNDGFKSPSSTSECEVVSSSVDVAVSGPNRQRELGPESLTKDRRSRESAKSESHHSAKDSREKARARARERTKERVGSSSIGMLVDGSRQYNEATNHQLASESPVEMGEESGITQNQNMNISLNLQADAGEGSSNGNENLGILNDMANDDSLVMIMSNNWSPSSIFNSLHNFGILQETFTPLENHGRPNYKKHIQW